MRIFDWIRRAFAEATEEGIKDGLRASGFVPVEAEGSATMALWLTNGTAKQLPAHKEIAPENDDKAASTAPSKKKERK